LVGISLLALIVLKTFYQYRPHVAEKLLYVFPILLSIWSIGKLHSFFISTLNSADLGILTLTLFLLIGYYFLYSLFETGRLWLLESGGFVVKWKGLYLVRSLLFLSIVGGIGLIDYLSARFGWTLWLVIIPFALFALSTFQIYSRNIRESSRRLSENSQLQMSIIETLALAIDAKDHSTHGHVRRVQAYAIGIAKSLGIESPDDLEALRTAALLHDIGKLAIPEYILSKPGSLTETEFTKMAKHAEIGANILAPIRFPYTVAPIILHHHERYNGTGYPSGLEGDTIPLGSRILSVADAFDALTSPRPYRNPLSINEAKDLIRRESGTSYDPLIVRAFLGAADKLAGHVTNLNTDRFSNNTCLPQPDNEVDEEYRLWLRKKSFTEIVRTQREISSLYEIFQTVGKSLNAQDTMSIISVKLKSLIPYDSCVIYLRDKKGDTIYPAAVTGNYAESLQMNWLRLGEGLTGYSIAFKQPVINLEAVNDFKNLPHLEKPHRLINSLIFPLQSDGSAYGAIALYSSIRNEEIYSEDHVRVMETISSRAAVSIQNALSYESYEENALTDPLTGLPNSRFMFMTFEQNVKKADRFNEQMALLIMDLNHFKVINDSFGHPMGDKVLIKVGETLQREMRKYDVCVRYAGDEFVVFLANTDRFTAERIAQRIKNAIGALVIEAHTGSKLSLGISIGISVYPEDGIELNQLFTLADSRMYKDKMIAQGEGLQQDQAELKEATSQGDERTLSKDGQDSIVSVGMACIPSSEAGCQTIPGHPGGISGIT
jgi:diguanylate cyclase (GGDEF)-like protein/putative nucleotidyltransferase with HDIG domain